MGCAILRCLDGWVRSSFLLAEYLERAVTRIFLLDDAWHTDYSKATAAKRDGFPALEESAFMRVLIAYTVVFSALRIRNII